MAVRAFEHVRRMRGGANSHLMRAGDGRYYVVKFRNNPQHTRVLVNELICSVLLDYLGLPAPGWEIVEVPAELIEVSPGLTMEFGREQRRCEAGLHFGSRFPVDPARHAVYDYVPLSLLRLVVNVDSFLGMVAFDKWISNANGRQAVFFRDRAGKWLPLEGARTPEGEEVSPRSLVYVANMIDHGFAFNAHNWEFSDLPEQGLYTRREVYDSVRGLESFEPWLGRITSLPTDVLDEAYRRIPPEWFDEDWDALEGLLERLYARRALAPELVRNGKAAGRDPFPNWSTAAASGGRR